MSNIVSINYVYSYVRNADKSKTQGKVGEKETLQKEKLRREGN